MWLNKTPLQKMDERTSAISCHVRMKPKYGNIEKVNPTPNYHLMNYSTKERTNILKYINM